MANSNNDPSKELKPVIVKWLDIVSWSGWNDDLIENKEDEPAVFYTVGFIVNKTKHKLTITDCGDGVIGNITTFPMGCIQEIIPLKVK